MVNLPHFFHVVYGFVPDYMHCVLLGVTRQLSKLWLEESGSEFYIGSPDYQRVVNARLSKIKPHQYIRRLPRDPQGVPCLKDIFHQSIFAILHY